MNKRIKLNFIPVSLWLFAIALLFFSCDENETIDFIPPSLRDRGEQQVTDSIAIKDYLKSHYYNSVQFEAITDKKIDSLEFMTIEDINNAGKEVDNYTLLNEAVDSLTVFYLNVDYKIYYLDLKTGGGVNPKFTDSVLVKYEGIKLDDEIFDSAVSPVYKDLTELILGWSLVLPKFKTAVSFNNTESGQLEPKDQGIGVMFLPSGLAYFQRSFGNIAAYSPLIFKFELLHTIQNDHDNDGILSHDEDLFTAEGLPGSDGIITINTVNRDDTTDDDSDGDGIPDFADQDDDGDGIFTIYEDKDGDGDPTNDIGSNGIPLYLDPTEY